MHAASEPLMLLNDPGTSAQQLFEIAQQHPELGPRIAAHPNAYPELMSWVSGQQAQPTAAAGEGAVKTPAGNATLWWVLVGVGILLILAPALLIRGSYLLTILVTIPGIALLVVSLIMALTTRKRALKAQQIEKQRALRQQEQRVAAIQQWQLAYARATGGQLPPPSSIPPAGFMPADLSQRTNTMAILALIFGLGGGLLGIVFGHVSLSQIKRTGENGRGLAVAGLVLGYTGLVIGMIAATIFIVTLATSA